MCTDATNALIGVLALNVQSRWLILNSQLAGTAVSPTDREIGGEIVDAGVVGAINLLLALNSANVNAGLIRQYVASIPNERRALATWYDRAKGDRSRRLRGPLSALLALYDEQLAELRSLERIAECLEAREPGLKPRWAWDAGAEAPEAPPQPIKNPDHLVVLLHGIQTEAAWQELVANVLRRTGVVEVVPIKYGYFDLLRFIGPGPLRIGPIVRVHRELRDIRKKYPNARLSVIAHSFGTYAICAILEDFGDLVLDRLILCGSVVKEDFRWDRIREQVRHKVVNECGATDIWPRLAAAASKGYGASGTRGFGAWAVRDRFHPGSHSDYFTESFVSTYWVPYILFGALAASPFEPRRSKPPLHHTAVGWIPIRWIIVCVVVGGIVGFHALMHAAWEWYQL
jgi:pimeloyl-ACP methyl ester carboxylesterase